MKEFTLQHTVFSYLAREFPEAYGLAFHPKIEGKRHRGQWEFDQLMGVKAGVPDIVIPWYGKCIMIELKKDKGSKVRKSQKEYMEKAKKVGCVCLTSYDIHEIIDFLKRELLHV